MLVLRCAKPVYNLSVAWVAVVTEPSIYLKGSKKRLMEVPELGNKYMILLRTGKQLDNTTNSRETLNHLKREKCSLLWQENKLLFYFLK